MTLFSRRILPSSRVDQWTNTAIAGQRGIVPFLSYNTTESAFWIAGPNVTASSTANTFGSWTEVIASASSPISTLLLGVVNGTSAVATGSVLEIGVGAAGSETTIMQVACGSLNVNIPLVVQIPVGTRVSARFQSVVSSRVLALNYRTFPQQGDYIAARSADSYGVNLSTSRGTNLAANNAWTQITASTTQPYRALIPILSASTATMNGDGTFTQQLGIGAAGSETVLTNLYYQTFTSETMFANVPSPVMYVGHVPVGSRLALRQSSANTYIDGCIIGIPYP